MPMVIRRAIRAERTLTLMQVKPAGTPPLHAGAANGSNAMPYASNDDLPPAVRQHLPPHAQDIFRGAFNHTWETYASSEPWRIEEIAHRGAWAAVKKRYRKVGDTWVPHELAADG